VYQFRNKITEPQSLGDAVSPIRGATRAVPASRYYVFCKRAIDASFALAALILLSPVFFVIAVAIRTTTPGPALYTQRRFGKGGTTFHIYKFRTMCLEGCDYTSTLQTQEGDPRITRLGRLLRRCDLDEYPQLLNVLKGEMSLVGPRPHAIEMMVNGTRYTDIVPDHDARHSVKPGLTGLAQVSGCAGPVKTVPQALRRHELDLAYVQQMSISFDIALILRTLGKHLHQFASLRRELEGSRASTLPVAATLPMAAVSLPSRSGVDGTSPTMELPSGN
jgi:lipopolysaccharide/colanic/teichoic acid biosynthesis glycosyltransferase